MEYLLSKLLPLFVYPLGMAILFVLLGVALIALDKKIAAASSIITAVALLWIFSTPVVSAAIMNSLEQRYLPVPLESIPKTDAIVVLGGISKTMLAEAADPQFGDGIDRLLYALRLYRAGKSKAILLTGGAAENFKPEAQLAAGFLEEQGIPSEALLLETKSRNTRQNASYSLEIMEAQNINHILLVTSAFHMRRAQATFERIGIKVTPAATDYRVPERDSTILNWLPDSEALISTTIGIKEYLGWWVYQWRGWI